MELEAYKPYLATALQYFNRAFSVIEEGKKNAPSMFSAEIPLEKFNPLGGVYRPFNDMHVLLRRAAYYHGSLLDDPSTANMHGDHDFAQRFKQYGEAPTVTLYFSSDNGKVEPVTIENKDLGAYGLKDVSVAQNLSLAQALLIAGQASNKITIGSERGAFIEKSLGTDRKLANAIANIGRILHKALEKQGLEAKDIQRMMSRLEVSKPVFERASREFENAVGVLVAVSPLMRYLGIREYKGIGMLETRGFSTVEDQAGLAQIIYSRAARCQDIAMVNGLLKLAAQFVKFPLADEMLPETSTAMSAETYVKQPQIRRIADMIQAKVAKLPEDKQALALPIFEIIDRTRMPQKQFSHVEQASSASSGLQI